MATRKLTLTGPVRWAKVFPENRDMTGYEGAFLEHDGAYTIEVGLTEGQLKDLKKTGSMLKGREGEDGLQWVKFKRKHTDRFEWASGAPEVTGPTDRQWTMEDDGLIGNDSEAEVSVSVYDTSRDRIKGTRLESVKVLRAYEPPKPDAASEEIPF